MTCAIYCRLSREDAEKIRESESIQNRERRCWPTTPPARAGRSARSTATRTIRAPTGTAPAGTPCSPRRSAGSSRSSSARRSPVSRATCSLVEKSSTGCFRCGGYPVRGGGGPRRHRPQGQQKGPPDQRPHQRVVSRGPVGEHPRGVRAKAQRKGKYIGSIPAYGYRKRPRRPQPSRGRTGGGGGGPEHLLPLPGGVRQAEDRRPAQRTGAPQPLRL